MEVRHLFLGQDSLVQAPVLKKPAYSPPSHSPSLNFTMDNSLSCRLPGCGFSTTSHLPAGVEHYLHSQLFVLHIRFNHLPKEASVSDKNAAPTAVKMSKSAKKRRRKKGSSYQTKVVDSDKDTASMEVSQSDSVVQIDGVGVCLHEVVKFECRGNLVRIVCSRCTEKSNVPNIRGSELTAGTDVTGLHDTDCNGFNDAPDTAPSELTADTSTSELAIRLTLVF